MAISASNNNMYAMMIDDTRDLFVRDEIKILLVMVV